MNSSSNIFSSMVRSDPADSDLLTERIYAYNELNADFSTDQQNALNELRKLAGEEVKAEPFKQKNNGDSGNTLTLEESIQRFHQKHAEQIKEY
jgi:hypothetical protein